MNPDSSEGRAVADRLGRERARIKGEIDGLARNDEQHGAITLSGDAAADTAQANTNLELQEELDAQLAEVDAALERLASGTYGIDEVTGEPIDPARLEALPTARRNI